MLGEIRLIDAERSGVAIKLRQIIDELELPLSRMKEYCSPALVA
jgi:hypothetical protein